MIRMIKCFLKLRKFVRLKNPDKPKIKIYAFLYKVQKAFITVPKVIEKALKNVKVSSITI
jgi:hypothetical protein